MAVFTPITLEEADRLARQHHLGTARRVIPVPAGSVNSNFILETDTRPCFLRIYEEQEVDGVAYEWSLLDHLRASGLPVPARIDGPPAGTLRVAGKPIALFEIAGGGETCQAGVTVGRGRAVGAFLGRAHRAAASFPVRREGRFGLDRVEARLPGIDPRGSEDVVRAIARLKTTFAELRADIPRDLPVAVIHGDLFRDNVRWDGDTIVCALDWESASDGALVYDLAVALLAWCFGDDMRWDLARAMCDGYTSARPLEESEQRALRAVLRAACARFATTRITDYELRDGIGERVHKDFRRFLARLDAVEAETDESLRARLGL